MRSTALSDRLRLLRGIVVVLTRSAGLVRGVRMVLALVVFLSGAFGRLVLADNPTAKHCRTVRAGKGVMLWMIR
jgi:hypothetical protein